MEPRDVDEDAAPGFGPAQRQTAVGRFLWDYSLDYLPTLVNVLRDGLSLVGPWSMSRR